MDPKAFPMHDASKDGNLERLKELHKPGTADLLHGPDNEGRTTLRLAAAHGHLNVAEYLLDNGADVNKSHPKTGRTPLIAAIGNQHYDMVWFLISRGAEVELDDKRGITPLAYACMKGNTRIASLLCNNGAAHVNDKDMDGLTPFLHAVENGHIDVIKKVLVPAKVDVKATDITENSALHYACSHTMPDIDMVEYLISLGVPVNGKNKYNQSPRTCLLYNESCNQQTKEKIAALLMQYESN